MLVASLTNTPRSQFQRPQFSSHSELLSIRSQIQTVIEGNAARMLRYTQSHCLKIQSTMEDKSNYFLFSFLSPQGWEKFSAVFLISKSLTCSHRLGLTLQCLRAHQKIPFLVFLLHRLQLITAPIKIHFSFLFFESPSCNFLLLLLQRQ